jgi:hypothetical protein
MLPGNPTNKRNRHIESILTLAREARKADGCWTLEPAHNTNDKAEPTITDLARSNSDTAAPKTNGAAAQKAEPTQAPQRTPVEQAIALLNKGMLDNMPPVVTATVAPQVEPLAHNKSLVVPLATLLEDLLSKAWVACSVEDGWPPLTSAKRKRRTKAISALWDLRKELVALATPNKIKPAIEPDKQRVEQ